MIRATASSNASAWISSLPSRKRGGAAKEVGDVVAMSKIKHSSRFMGSSFAQDQSASHEPAAVVVIGGGAAGYFGAIRAAEAHPGTRVVLLEATRRPLTKVRISGGG